MSVIRINNSESVVNFCEKQSDVGALDAAKAKHDIGCLSPANRERYDQAIRGGKYIPAIGAVWKDPENRSRFLASYTEQLHAPLMFEEAIERFRRDPRMAVAINTSLPLIRAASFRVRQDAVCSADGSVSRGDAHIRMSMVYSRILAREFRARFGMKMPNPSELVIKAKVEAVARASINRELPSPNWIGEHGMGVFLGGVKMKAAVSHSGLRNNFARKELRKLGVRAAGDEVVREGPVEVVRVAAGLEGMRFPVPRARRKSCCERVRLFIIRFFAHS